jgi:fructokinase
MSNHVGIHARSPETASSKSSGPPQVRSSVLSTGYITLDVLIHGKTIRHAAGGTAGNVAANLAWLGVRSSVAGVVGEDGPGALVIDDLRTAGVDTSMLVRARDWKTPTLIHEIRGQGHRFLFGCPTCGRKFPRYRPLPWTAAPGIVESISAEVGQPDVLFIDRANSFTVELARILRKAGTQVVFEPSTAGQSSALETLTSLADVVKVSSERLEGLVHRLPDIRSAQLLVLTDGANGVSVRRGDELIVNVHAPAANVVDPGGAGDYLTAYMIALCGRRRFKDLGISDLGEILELASAAASMSCSYPGARGLARHLSSSAVAQRVRKQGASARRGTQPRSGNKLPWLTPLVPSSCQACLV